MEKDLTLLGAPPKFRPRRVGIPRITIVSQIVSGKLCGTGNFHLSELRPVPLRGLVVQKGDLRITEVPKK